MGETEDPNCCHLLKGTKITSARRLSTQEEGICV